MKIEFGELQEATKKVVELLKAKGHPHMTVIIQQDRVELMEGIVGVPIPYENKQGEQLKSN